VREPNDKLDRVTDKTLAEAGCADEASWRNMKDRSLFGSRAFLVSTPTLWNLLPHSFHFCESLTTFQKHLKYILFSGGILFRPLATHYPSTPDSVLAIDSL